MGKRTQTIMLALLCALALTACATGGGIIYGPEATPAQIEDAVYEDAFAIGAMWAAREPGKADHLVAMAEALRDGMDTELNVSSQLTLAWTAALKEGDITGAFMMFTLRKLYTRLGIKIDGELIDTSMVDKALLYSAASAFIAGVQTQQQ